MRVLVEQTERETKTWLERLVKAGLLDQAPGVRLLMGGEDAGEWHLEPDADAILIGTQDMLLSRAMNRGYGASRFRWPIDFGLLNNDCLWVMDEVQLMGVGSATTAQLDAFRASLGTYGPTSSMWMSATLESTWLATVDHHPEANPAVLSPDDLRQDSLAKRMNAGKTLQRSSNALEGTTKADVTTFATLAVSEVIAAHRPGTLTLVITNTVARASALHRALGKELGTDSGKPDLRLIHSRFRAAERAGWSSEFLHRDAEIPPEGRIIVATQVIEAGVDITATTMFTEQAPWPSLVQRFGRCNRFGDDDGAVTTWWAIPPEASAPYDADALKAATTHLKALEGKSVAPSALDTIPCGDATPPAHILRRGDLVGLFDTSPDLSGNDLDVGRYIREGEELDALVFWREVQELDEESAPQRQELCPVSVGQLQNFLKKHPGNGWVWDHLEAEWTPIRAGDLRPGMRILLRAKEGGYDLKRGWYPASKAPVTPVYIPEATKREDATGGDPDTHAQCWQTLRGHAIRTHEKATQLLDGLSDLELPPEVAEAVARAARYHDLGKAHAAFQETLFRNVPDETRQRLPNEPMAKSPNKFSRHSRKYFRHELAGGLALLDSPLRGDRSQATWDLICYLVVAHHGKVRVSIRSLPKEPAPPGDSNRRFARGVWDGETLPAADLGDGHRCEEAKLSLAAMEMGRDDQGRPSWQERALTLRDRDDLGPFRLAYLEALVRSADHLASRDPGKEGVFDA